MSLTSQQYAGLAEDSYNDGYKVGIYPPGKEPPLEYEGVEYKILEHANNPLTGYQGTIYQRVDTGEIVVAHRGTEGNKLFEGLVKDGVVTDGAMMAARFNPQVDDAIELTQHAIDKAKDIGQETGRAPEVTVTGHSLGGAHAEITAFHFNLKGETFNAYGAVSLGYRIPEGGNAVINHVMAADTVSAASPHYGQVKVYAAPKEIAMLHDAGYANNHNPLDLRSPGRAFGANLGSHSMHNFLNVDANGKPDRSMLADPTNQQLAQIFEPMIDKFRDDMKLGRQLATAVLRGPMGHVQDGIDYVRGPQEPGAPAARDEQRAQQHAESARRAEMLQEQIQQFEKAHPPRTPPWAVSQTPTPAPVRPAETSGTSDPSRPFTLPDYSPPVQTGPHTRGHRRQSHSEEAQEHQDVRPHRNDQARTLPADHRDYALFEAIRRQLPEGTSPVESRRSDDADQDDGRHQRPQPDQGSHCRERPGVRTGQNARLSDRCRSVGPGTGPTGNLAALGNVR